MSKNDARDETPPPDWAKFEKLKEKLMKQVKNNRQQRNQVQLSPATHQPPQKKKKKGDAMEIDDTSDSSNESKSDGLPMFSSANPRRSSRLSKPRQSPRFRTKRSISSSIIRQKKKQKLFH